MNFAVEGRGRPPGGPSGCKPVHGPPGGRALPFVGLRHANVHDRLQAARDRRTNLANTQMFENCPGCPRSHSSNGPDGASLSRPAARQTPRDESPD